MAGMLSQRRRLTQGPAMKPGMRHLGGGLYPLPAGIERACRSKSTLSRGCWRRVGKWEAEPAPGGGVGRARALRRSGSAAMKEGFSPQRPTKRVLSTGCAYGSASPGVSHSSVAHTGGEVVHPRDMTCLALGVPFCLVQLGAMACEINAEWHRAVLCAHTTSTS